MLEVSDKQFETMVAIGIDHIPRKFLDNLNNVAFVVEDQPTAEQRVKLRLRHDQSLYGLYEGIPLTKRGAGYNLVLPDKITIFKQPILQSSETMADLQEQVNRTIWHEVAHFYGLDHQQIYALEAKERSAPRQSAHQPSSRSRALRYVGIGGVVVSVGLFLRTPSFPTPDKLLVFLTFVFLCFGQAAQMLKRLAPFVASLIVYESFRGLAHQLNTRVHFLWMAQVDRWLFGSLPTATLQGLLWSGRVRWYDFVFYIAYMLHFVMPLGLALFIWKKRDTAYWQYVFTYVTLSFAGFLTYLIVPAAPPWMASDMHIIEPITRVSSHVWYALGVHDFPSVYNKISPNPVAAVPSLHAAYATLFALVVYKLFGKKWGLLASLYPTLLCFGIVYQGEHYVIDAILGILYAFASWYAVQSVYKWRRKATARAGVSASAAKRSGQ